MSHLTEVRRPSPPRGLQGHPADLPPPDPFRPWADAQRGRPQALCRATPPAGLPCPWVNPSPPSLARLGSPSRSVTTPAGAACAPGLCSQPSPRHTTLSPGATPSAGALRLLLSTSLSEELPKADARMRLAREWGTWQAGRDKVEAGAWARTPWDTAEPRALEARLTESVHGALLVKVVGAAREPCVRAARSSDAGRGCGPAHRPSRPRGSGAHGQREASATFRRRARRSVWPWGGDTGVRVSRRGPSRQRVRPRRASSGRSADLLGLAGGTRPGAGKERRAILTARESHSPRRRPKRRGG